MSVLDIVLLVIAGVLLAVVLIGLGVSRRHAEAREAALLAHLATANEALAQAHAEDNGWDRATMEAAARAAYDGPVDALHLVHVIDKPGVDDDEAVFHAVSAGRSSEIRLARRGGTWASA